jgi:glutamate carboxypeptidase
LETAGHAATAAWVAAQASRIAAVAPGRLRTLVDISSPSGDIPGAEAAVAAVRALLPPQAGVERVPCSSAGHADDLVARVRGDGTRRVLLLGHLDTVVQHGDHRPLTVDGDRLVGSGAADMKGGDVLAIELMRALADGGPGAPPFAEVALLLVNDEEWRVAPFAHVDRFAGFDACLCFEAGQRGPDGEEGVVVRRKAAGTIRVRAHGREAHSGSAPEKGANALLALATAARAVAEAADPDGEQALTSVPTMLRAGEAFNVVPGAGELIGDVRARSLEAFDAVLAAIPRQVDGVRLEAELVRTWPGMDASASAAPVLARASELAGMPLHAGARGGASDASHFAGTIPITIDGLGPRGGGAHAPHEYVSAASLEPRARVALAVAAAVLGA